MIIETTKLLILFTLFSLLTACITKPAQHSTLKQNYDRAAQYHGPDRNPIIVIPGILGSRLVDDATGQVVWGAFSPKYVNPSSAKGARLIALPLDAGASSNTQVRPDGVLENLEVNLLGFPLKVQVYADILRTLGVGGYRDESLGLNSVDYGTDHFTCFQFDYDWRRDTTYNAQALKKFIDEKRKDIQKHYAALYGIQNAEVKFDIAAHSLGGLLTRYYLRYGDAALPDDGSLPTLTWAGAQDVERVILVAPPNAGSLKAFSQLLDGYNTGRPLLPHFEPALVGTFQSVYQLLPRNRHQAFIWDDDVTRPVEDIFDASLWQKYGWGLSGTDSATVRILESLLPDIEDAQLRQQIALKFQRSALTKAKQFHAAIDRPAEPPLGVELFLVSGDTRVTPEVFSIDSQSGQVSVFQTGAGDGVVLRSSSLMDERVGQQWKPLLQTPIEWSSVLFLPSSHRRITTDPVFEDNVLYWLLEAPKGIISKEY